MIINKVNRNHSKRHIPSFKAYQRIIAQSSSLTTYIFDKCKNNCIAYTSVYNNLNHCPICNTERTHRLSENTWSFNSPIDLLCERWKCLELAKLLQYRKTRKSQDSVINDVWDSKYIKNLTEKIIVVDGVETNSKHFEDTRESALALATDGISIFRSQTKSCWPLFLIDYLLPPEVRTKKNFIINVTVIPGPLKQKQVFDSFLKPIVDSLKLLQIGKKVYDTYTKTSFTYKAHVTHIVGDSPAINKLMGIKGTNSIYPCRNCKIKAQKGPKGVYYPSLKPPLTLQTHNHVYFFHNLPMRTHKEWLKILKHNENRKGVVNDYGIKSRSPLLELSSITLPFSFCIDTMHLILENLISMIWKHLRGIGNDIFKNPLENGNDLISKDDLRKIEKELTVSTVKLFSMYAYIAF